MGLREGSLANVSWLQEFPDPVTKICWDNYLCVSIEMSQKYHLKEGQRVLLKVGESKLKVPVHIQPGQHSKTLSLALGYGQKFGSIAENIGQNAFELANFKKGFLSLSNLKATMTPLNEAHRLACVQDHHSMEGRQIVVEATLDQYKKNKSAGIHRHKVFSLWDKHKYPNKKWGMVIDLNSCTGCSACVIACQSENNIPVVGKKYVLKGREMHWIRIDRYYSGKPKDPDALFMPILCQHCDNAPCETVCPVAATVHSDEGTNDMIYNRCVGTRYCANNCPYKVRRFNWFNYAKRKEPLNMQLNPEVTVRSRGVMEKCTFCIHRIKQAQFDSKVAEGYYEQGGDKAQNKALKDRQVASAIDSHNKKEILTACQQSCPADAITFGDLNDKNSKVSKAFHSPRSYALLEELNAQPAVRFQTRIRNKKSLKGATHGGHSKGGGHH